MRTIFKITDEQKYDGNVVDVDTTGLNASIYNSRGKLQAFGGTIEIDVVGRGWVSISGEHGLNDYCEEYGFELTTKQN